MLRTRAEAVPLTLALCALSLGAFSSSAGFPQTIQPGVRISPRPGERLLYDISWSRFLTAGTLTLAVEPRQVSERSTAYHIVGEARPSRLVSALHTLYYRVETVLDAETLLPQEGIVYSEEGERQRTKITRFDHAANRAQYEVHTPVVSRKEIVLSPSTRDALSVLYELRTTPLEPGDRLSFPILDGGKLYTVYARVGGAESVETGLGVIRGLPISIEVFEEETGAIDGGISLWLSDDRRRLPVKIRVELSVGSFVATLRDAR